MPLNDKQQAQFDTVCQRIAEGESLVDICKRKDMPDYSTVCRWLQKDGEEGAVRKRYARAREDQADFYADQIIAIADNEPDAQKARNRVDARKWVASKLKPKRYGDKVQHGGDSDNPIKHEVIKWISVKAGD